MPMKLLSADDFRDAAKDGARPDGTVFRFATTDPQNVDGADRTKRFVFSDATVDHAGDTIDPKGWDLAIFKRNPVALFSHMSWEPPIGRASNVSVKDGKLSGDIEFASADVYEFADTIFRLVDGGFMNAVSVGFKPKDWAFTSDKNRPYGIDFKKQTLLEISVCPVPCNPNALTEARSAGIDTSALVGWAEKVLDSGDILFMPRKDVEALRSQSGAIDKRYYLQVPPTMSVEIAQTLRDEVKRWRDDPSEILVLVDGVALRTLGDEPAIVAPLADTEDKAGARVSAATKAKLMEAMDHHDAATKCIKDAMGDCTDDGPDNEPDADPDDSTKTILDPPADPDEHLSPEERRVNEVRALKATLPNND